MDRFKKLLDEKMWRVVVAVIVAMILVGLGMIAYIRASIHNERVVHIAAQATTTRDLMNKVIDEYSNYTDMCSNIVNDELHSGMNVQTFMEDVQSELYMDDARLILVDDSCIWYGEGRTTGRITARAAYASDTDRKEIYLTRGVDADVDSIVCRVRLDNPIHVTTDTGDADIAYCAVICYTNTLSDELSVSFPYQCNRFIINKDGFMLYKDFKMGILVEGSNVFSKYQLVDFLYGDTGESQLKSIKKGETTVGEFVSDGEHFFISTTKLDYNDWYLCYVVNASELSAGSYFIGIVVFMTALGLLLVIGAIILLSMKAKRDQSDRMYEIEKQANVILEEASRAKTEFLSNMSHDIRTPINGIVGMTALAKKENNPPKTEECLKKIEGASSHLMSLVNDVLDMTSIESGKITLVTKPTDIRVLADNCASIIEGQLRNRTLNFVKDYSDIEHPYMLIDELRLKQILINILGNAVKFTNDGGTITFGIHEIESPEPSDGRIVMEFTVRDTGIGMKPEFIGHIWDSFAQEDGGSRTNYKGTGLGMPISKKFTELMEGTIEVESVYNEGSCFIVRIPFEICDKPELTSEAVEGGQGLVGAKIMLAEDNDLNVEIARELLEDEGAIVSVVRNGREALEAFEISKAGDYDVILMDIMMPEMTGLEASRAIRALDREDAKTIPIIAMTANAFAEDIKATYEAGMNEHLSKPIDINKVIKTVSAFYHNGGRSDRR